MRAIDSDDTRRTPELLWKYRSWGVHAADMISKGEIYFARAKELNDPFEFHWQERWPAKRSERDRLVRETLAQTFPDESIANRRVLYEQMLREVEEKAANARKNRGYVRQSVRFTLGVFSVSEIWDHPLMWSHYADHHRGVCIAIYPRKILTRRFIPVHYSDEVPQVNVKEYVERNATLFVQLSSKKSATWSYEKEWRTVNSPGPVQCPSAIARVIVGAQASEETVAEVRDAVEQSGRSIPIHLARLRDSAYELELDYPIA